MGAEQEKVIPIAFLCLMKGIEMEPIQDMPSPTSTIALIKWLRAVGAVLLQVFAKSARGTTLLGSYGQLDASNLTDNQIEYQQIHKKEVARLSN